MWLKTSPLAKALRAEEGTAILSFTSDIAQLSQLDPSVKFIFDAHEAARILADVRGTPGKVVRSEDEVVELMQHAAEQQQGAGAETAFPAIAGGVKDLALASQAAAGTGAQPPAGATAVPQGA